MRSILALLAIAACGGDDVDREVGARCDVNRDCVDRCLGPSNDFPDGFCSLDCNDNGDCPGDTDCTDLQGGVCLFVCLDNADCDFLGPNWICGEENLRENQNVKTSVCRGD